MEARLLALLQAGESLSVEFKGESRKELSDVELVESVVCLANRDREDDGWLLIGVEDDGTVTGARPRHGSITDPDRVAALIANRTRPSLSVRVSMVRLRGREVLAVQGRCHQCACSSRLHAAGSGPCSVARRSNRDLQPRRLPRGSSSEQPARDPAAAAKSATR